jgi:hypothetical protein
MELEAFTHKIKIGKAALGENKDVTSISGAAHYLSYRLRRSFGRSR